MELLFTNAKKEEVIHECDVKKGATPTTGIISRMLRTLFIEIIYKIT